MLAVRSTLAEERSATRPWPSLRVAELEQQIEHMRTSLICAFNQLLDLKDINTGVHSTRLAEWSVRVAQELGVDEAVLREVEVAALLHDIGKVGIPDSILRKPGRLDDAEYGLMKKHPEYGWAVLRLLPGLERASLFVLHHHESFNGKGYPAGLKEVEIPIGARIVSVIDAFDAMVSSRPYRQGMSPEEAIRRLILSSETQFDPAVVQCFLHIAQAEMPAVFAAAGTSVSAAL
jgi:HD-GYP domain-containing protein (c-di-GMP phosphodiesterase class II)